MNYQRKQVKEVPRRVDDDLRRLVLSMAKQMEYRYPHDFQKIMGQEGNVARTVGKMLIELSAK